MKGLTILWVLAILSVSASRSGAGVEEMGDGARAAGMAEAFVAVADDASAIHVNPAGLEQIHHIEIATQLGRFLTGLSDGSNIESSHLGLVVPLKKAQWGTLGLAYHNFKGSHFFNDRLLCVSYGRKVRQQSWGATLRQFHRQYEPDRYTANALNGAGVASGQADPLFANGGFTKDSYGLDVGTLYQFGPQEKYSAGVSVTNLNQPGTALGTDGEKAPLVVRGGLAVKTSWVLLSVELRRAKRLASGLDTETALGAEKRFALKDLGALSLRAGYGQGSRQFKMATAGMSIAFSKAQLDYAFQLPIGDFNETNASHRLSFSLKLGTVQTPQTVLPSLPTMAARSNHSHMDYNTDLNYYLTRKAEGASIQERLELLQDLYKRHSEAGIDLSWLSKELSSL